MSVFRISNCVFLLDTPEKSIPSAFVLTMSHIFRKNHGFPIVVVSGTDNLTVVSNDNSHLMLQSSCFFDLSFAKRALNHRKRFCTAKDVDIGYHYYGCFVLVGCLLEFVDCD